MEFLSKSNENANCVSEEDRFKFVDDLTALKKIALLTIGIASHNIKQQVPYDINTSNLFIPSQKILVSKLFKPNSKLDYQAKNASE